GGVFREALVFAQAAQHHTDARRPSGARLCTANAGPARRSLGIDRSSGCKGRVAIGVPDDYASSLLPSVLRKFSASYPKVEIQVIGMPSNALAPLIKE